MNSVEQIIKEKIERIGTPLRDWNISINYGIKTGCNEAFIINEATKRELIAEDPKSEEIIRPILRGRDIKRFSFDFSNLYIIATFPSKKYSIEDYPAVKKHLLSFYKTELIDSGNEWVVSNYLSEFCFQKLSQTGKEIIIDGKKIRNKQGQIEKARKKTGNKWFETQDQIAYWDDFSKPKIIYREISDALDACLDNSKILVNNKCYIVTGEHLPYLLCFLNSLLFSKILLPQANSTGGKGTDFLSKISLPIPSEQEDIKMEYLLKEKDFKSIDNYFFEVFQLGKDLINKLYTM